MKLTPHIKPTDNHQLFDSTSCHPYHCKKNIRYSQSLKYNSIYSDNERFNQRCNDLEKCLIERTYNDRMVRTQMLKAREKSKNNLLKRGNTRTSESILAFNINYHPPFQNVRNILHEPHTFLGSDKEHKNSFSWGCNNVIPKL